MGRSHVVTIGSIARQVITAAADLSVMGRTSRGVFLRSGENWVLFLSLERFRGPLTLNLRDGKDELSQLEPGDPVRFEDGSLNFPKTGLWVGMSEAGEWLPSAPKLPALAPDDMRARLEKVASLIMESPGAFDPNDLDALRNGLSARRAGEIASTVESLLGRGGGLTPSGDDLTVGLLLTLNRWRACFPLDLPVALINQVVCQAAVEKTTTLSANLIACAALGLADERLIQALDGLVTGAPDSETCGELLRGWGHHSGCDSFAGMAAALDSISSENV